MQLLFLTTAVLLTVCVFVQRIHGIRWLGIKLSSEHDWNKTDCRKIHGFVGKQYQICRKAPSVMKYISEAMEITKAECQLQLKNRRWNCSTITMAPNFNDDLKTGTKESAFVYSLAAAAVAYSVTQACSIGRLDVCGCGRTPKMKLKNKNWMWGGCSDNIAYGVRFSNKFTYAVERKRMMGRQKIAMRRAIMNIHNNQAGRLAVRNKMGVVCRCHGVSGSCQSKTCFRRLSDFKSVATVLKKRYDKVIHVISANKGKNYQTLKSRGGKPYSPVDLIALAGSPNYCKKSQSSGTLGTAGRECNPKTTGKGSCSYMCCGRGFKTFKKEIEERCECQYYWCCYVKCKKCKKTITVSTCLGDKEEGR